MANKPKRVLVVDDSVFMRALIKEIVAVDPDLEVVDEAGDGAAAILRVMKIQPDVIVLDIEMPKMDGIEVLKRLKLLSTARVVVLSSGAQLGSALAEKARKLGAFDIIPKPSGTVSMDLKAKRGHVLLVALHAAAGLPPPDFQALALRMAARGPAV